jgi:hypothetical protein
LYQQLEADVIADIARRVKKTGRYTETAELMVNAMAEKGESPAKIRAEVMKLLRADKAYMDAVAQNTKEYKRLVMEEIKTVEKEAERLGNDIVASAGDMAFNTDLSAWEQAGKKLTQDSAFTKLVEEMMVATAGTLKNITKTTGFKGASGFIQIQNAYTNALDRALIKMTSGAFSFDQAVNDMVRDLAQSGLRSVDYASGRSYQLDTAARMCLRTSSAQLSAQITEKHLNDTDEDLVEVDAHWGARPAHASWQGKIYSRSGKSRKYPSFSVCGYGRVDGICGINCRHNFYPFFAGISEPTRWDKEPAPKSYMGKEYTYEQATTKQREMERGIRAIKREIEAQKVIQGDTKALGRKKKLLIANYHAFSDKMDIRPKDNRLRVVSGSSNLNNTKVFKDIMDKVM